MKKNVMFFVTVFVVLSCFFSGTAFSEIRPGAFTISPMAGGYAFDIDDDYDNVLEMDDWGKFFVMTLGYNFSKNFSTEVGFGYIYTEPEVCCKEGDLNVYQPRVDFLYHIMPENRIVPYIALGASYLFFDDDDIAPVELDDTAQVNAGIGADFFVTEDLALRVDGRYYYGFEDSQNEYSVTAGIVYHIGGERKTEPCSDADNDGVCDENDRCPDTPAGVEVDSAGCTKAEPEMGMEKTVGTGQVVEKSDKMPPPPAPDMMTVTVWFDFDRTVIKSEYRARLEELAAFMQQHPETMAVIEGHTDSIGSEGYNQKLSEKRAGSLKQYLTEHFGIDPMRFELQGLGESRPVESNKTEEGRAQNRRAVTITIMK